MKEFKRSDYYGFNYVFEGKVGANESFILEMPRVTANKRGINDIGWQCNGDCTLYATLSEEPNSDGALWQELKDSGDVNKTISAIKVINGGGECTLVVRAILN